MNSERFEALADAFGGEVSRWPAAERDAAAALMLARPDWAAAVLALAGELDVRLLAYAAPRGAAELVERIVAAAPRSRKARWVAWLCRPGCRQRGRVRRWHSTYAEQRSHDDDTHDDRGC